jgi:glycyl-tRNA synthetase (class II)
VQNQNESSFGIAQTGKAFRNEIVETIYLRMREFEQKCNFVRPGDEINIMSSGKKRD